MKMPVKINNVLIKLLLLSGALLAFIQFFSGRSIWRDEAVLALNIINRSSVELLRPLDKLQVAPILYLQIQKLFSEVMPYSDLAFRIFPMLCFLLVLFFFYRILKLIFENKYSLVFALSLFVFNTMVLRYSSEVKQYMCDLLVYCVIAFILIQNHRSGKLNTLLLAITGIFSISLSNVAPVILLTAGLFFLQTPFARRKQTFLKFSAVATIWVLGFAIYYFLFIYDNPNIARVAIVFSDVYGFSTQSSFQTRIYNYFPTLLKTYFAVLLPFGKNGFYGLIGLFVYGFITMIMQKRFGLLLLSFAPVLIHFTLWLLQFYPALPRL
jgi:hypothetical protein